MHDKREILSQLLLETEQHLLFYPELWDDLVLMRICMTRLERGEDQAWDDLIQHFRSDRDLTATFRQLIDGSIYPVAGFCELLSTLELPESSAPPTRATAEERSHKEKSQIMYVESKPDLTGEGRIGRVNCSKTGKTLYYRDRAYQSLKGGYKRNYFDVATGDNYWISRCRKDGCDTLYAGIVKIDEDVREEYWQTIRQRPDMSGQKSFRSEGKHRK
jgi:hypothetical protein